MTNHHTSHRTSHHTSRRRTLAAFGLGLLLAGCANVAKISTGEVLVDNRLSFTLDAAWNQINLPGRSRPLLWTQDGMTVDALELWVGIRDGQALVEQAKDKRPLAFKASMELHEIVALFEGLYARDGSVFKLNQLAPAEFLGGKGVRFDYTVTRKIDDVIVTGVGWAAVRGGELHAMTFVAPRLVFFPRHLAKVEQAARSARLKT